MEGIHCSYYKCLDYMGIPNNKKRPSKCEYSEGYKRVYNKLINLELDDKTIFDLIKSFNERVNKFEKKYPFSTWSTNYKEFEYCDIKDHFVITHILYDMEEKQFNSKYTLYGDKDSKSSIFIGIDGVDNKDLNINDSVYKLINNGVFNEGDTIPEYPKFYSNRDAVRLNITQEGINAANERIERGIRTNWEATHSTDSAEFVKIMMLKRHGKK